MALSQEIKDRIFAAADELYRASETGKYPNIDAVRQECRASMNSVVEAMKEWRQNQRKQVRPVREPLPVELHSAVQSMGQSLWETAQQLAHESLDAAKAAFETEKRDLIQLSAEQSQAFDSQGAELEAAQARIVELDRQATAAAAAAKAVAQELEETRRARLVAEQRAEEIERRADELRAELDHAHAEAKTAAAQAKATAESLRTERNKALQRQELIEAESVKLAAKAASAREEAAALRGQLEATKTQNAGLMAALKPSPTGKGKDDPAKG